MYADGRNLFGKAIVPRSKELAPFDGGDEGVVTQLVCDRTQTKGGGQSEGNRLNEEIAD